MPADFKGKGKSASKKEIFMIYDKKNVRVLTAAALLSCAAGLTNGFLGAGGGIILFWLLKKLYPTADPSAVRDNFATVVLCVLLLSTVSAVSYSHKGSVDTSALSEVVIPGILGRLSHRQTQYLHLKNSLRGYNDHRRHQYAVATATALRIEHLKIKMQGVHPCIFY